MKFVSAAAWSRTLTRCSCLLFFIHTSSTAPVQGHLALTDNGMSVTWQDKNVSECNVVYGTSPNSLSTSTIATARTYTRAEMCGAPANQSSHWVDPGTAPPCHTHLIARDSPSSQLDGGSRSQSLVSPRRCCEPLSLSGILGTIFYAEMDLTSVKRGSTVYYSFGSSTARSQVFNFTHGPKSQAQTAFIAYGDMGLMGEYHQSTQEILAHLSGVDFVLHIGDIAYAEGDAARWDRLLNTSIICVLQLFATLRVTPLHGTPGGSTRSSLSLLVCLTTSASETTSLITPGSPISRGIGPFEPTPGGNAGSPTIGASTCQAQR